MSDAFQLQLDLIFLQGLNRCRYSGVKENALNWIYGLATWDYFFATLLYKKETESIWGYALSFQSCMTYSFHQMTISIVVVKVELDCELGIEMFSVLYDIIVDLKKISTECTFNEKKTITHLVRYF